MNIFLYVYRSPIMNLVFKYTALILLMFIYSSANAVVKTTFKSNILQINKMIIQDYQGLWQSVNDNLDTKRSIVKIFIEGGNLKGKVVRFIDQKVPFDDPICDRCKGYRHNQKIIGMDVINDMVFIKDKWRNGEILDPSDGKTYGCRIWIKNGVLNVRGYVGIFYHTQKWYRVKNEESKNN